ncbi:hypothetical protein [Pseudovibrio sp. POLY-S9]|uniref:hypothetical protein n=1 Tax=Pseudovibrio sp. POLY-S9 TaxID=1576596 RepID=UPI000708D925|nr:hypothetical protein [Pseudovibrio sp. POLY-S9]
MSEQQPVPVDKLESMTGEARGKAILELARAASSGKARARSCFLFSAILPPPASFEGGSSSGEVE